jgi:hypothetical protein
MSRVHLGHQKGEQVKHNEQVNVVWEGKFHEVAHLWFRKLCGIYGNGQELLVIGSSHVQSKHFGG